MNFYLLFIAVLLALSGCRQERNVEAMLADTVMRDKIMTAIVNDRYLMDDMMEHMRKSELAMQMMRGNRHMMKHMMSDEQMAQMMRQDTAMMNMMMHHMMGAAASDTSLCRQMCSEMMRNGHMHGRMNGMGKEGG